MRVDDGQASPGYNASVSRVNFHKKVGGSHITAGQQGQHRETREEFCAAPSTKKHVYVSEAQPHEE